MSANTSSNETAPYELLGAHNLQVDLGGTTILRNVSLSIGPGERVAIVGPNGAGKTTLMRALTGAVPATSGEVILCTEPIQRLSRETIARSVAVVSSDITLPFATRVEDLVALGRIPHGRGPAGPTAHDRERATAAIERVGATHLQHRDVRTLSAGERQLAAIALGLAQLQHGGRKTVAQFLEEFRPLIRPARHAPRHSFLQPEDAGGGHGHGSPGTRRGGLVKTAG